ncbi:TraB/GumN family protein [Pseudoflavitalea sp. X16]|uniref:TraB/GumN family protein n=1 Tax=Paraflavitalea devenefica TaxID=2716334 RepID=UPI0014207BC6|nr:TraB/GumN family protein [Paraflavitalea devenefica]NII29267.1 TraB/GumN family protein [Paraflavitalea devenefica]
MKYLLRIQVWVGLLLQALVLMSSGFAQTLPVKIATLRADDYSMPQLRLKQKVGADSFEVSEAYGPFVVRWAFADTNRFYEILHNNGFKKITYHSDSVSWIEFSRGKEIAYQRGGIRFDEYFFENAVIKKNKIRPTTKQLLLFVEDPHNFSGEIPYLRNAITSVVLKNPSIAFYFLNEGFYGNNSVEVSLDSLYSVLSATVPAAYQVSQLTKNFIIDLAMECQVVLREKDIKQYAIDDSATIQRTLRYERTASNLTYNQKERIYSLQEEYENSPLYTYPGDDIGSEWLSEVQYWEGFRNWLVRKRERTLAQFAANEIRIIRSYLKRDTMMAEKISNYLSRFQNQIPFVFIGAAHLEGIVRLLPDSVGYLLISSKHSGLENPDFAFDSLRFINSREAALRKFASDTLLRMKLPVSPFAHEWKWIRKGLATINRSFNRIVDKFRQYLGESVATELISSVKHNPSFNQYKPDFDPNGFNALQEKHPGAFAKTEGDRIIFYHDHNYSGNTARMNFLKEIQLAEHPYTENVVKYIDPESGHSFLASFDVLGECWYLYDLGEMPVRLKLFRSSPNSEPRSQNTIRSLINTYCKN